MELQATMFPARVRENEIMGQVREYLTLRGYWFWRNNSGVARDGGRFIRYGVPGMPDYTVVLGTGETVWVEVKRPVGGQVSLDQTAWMLKAQQHGQRYVLCKDVQDLLDSGL